MKPGLEVVYRAGTKEALDQATAALRAVGVGMQVLWSAGTIGYALPHPPTRTGAFWTPGQGTILVLPEDAERARQVLAEWEATSRQRVREHMGGLPRDVRRIVLLGAAVLFLVWTFAGAWADLPGWMALLAVAVVGLVAWEVRIVLARRREARQAPPAPTEAPDRWFGG